MSTLLPPGLRARQGGVVLVISLLLLLVLTMIGLAATRGTTIEQRMTAGQNDQEVAFEAAEAALRAGESALVSGNLNYAANTAGAYTQVTMGNTSWQNINWSPDGTAVLPYTTGLHPTPLVKPSFFIVLSPLSPPGVGDPLNPTQAVSNATLYYVYARGVGLTGNTAVILQSAYEVSN